ncbi:glycosyltransferase [Ursidibacter sp. B-7004-1]
MGEMKTNKTVAVITSTIGRAELVRAIDSVKQQSYPCKHYVFVDGEQYHQQAKIILDKYPDVIATYLPMNTGADGWTNSSINAIAPFLVKEDIICYLDDDNWYERNHIESGVSLLQDDSYDFAFSLRNLYDSKKEFITKDCIESIGFYKSALPKPIKLDINVFDKKHTVSINMSKESHVDTNCFFLKKEVAIFTSKNWVAGKDNDTQVWNALRNNKFQGICTKVFTVNYIFEPLKCFGGNILKDETYSATTQREIGKVIIQSLNNINLEKLGGVYEWDK